MTTLTRGERLIHSVICGSAALVTVAIIGIGYQQQTYGGMQPAGAFLAEDSMQPQMMDLQLEADLLDTKVWCCSGDADLCYEQLASNGCAEGEPYLELDDCTSACS